MGSAAIFGFPGFLAGWLGIVLVLALVAGSGQETATPGTVAGLTKIPASGTEAIPQVEHTVLNTHTDASNAAPPVRPDPLVLAEGQALFRGLCSGCHGGSGRGGKGPDLTDDRWIHGSSDDALFKCIRDGVPGTTMKKLGDSLKPDQIHKLIAHIRSLARSPGESTWKPYTSGNPQAGRKLFFDLKGKLQCAKCHSIGGEGGRIGPALDRIASRRAAEFVMESILEPSREIAPEYETVAVATKEGRVVTGLRINETNFSIQINDENGQFHSWLKRDLDAVKVMKKSLMPENFGELLTVRELHDVFAYLMTLE
jgi:putative heme-binding domain-containing protein